MTEKASLTKIKKFNEETNRRRDEASKNSTTPNASDLTNKEKIKEKAKEKTEEELAKELEEQKQAEEKQRLDALEQNTLAISTLIDRVNQQTSGVKNWIASQPTPGGIAALLVMIAFVALALIPVNSQGQTRLYLFYQSLLGRTHMKYSEGQNNTSNVSQFGGSAGATFGTQPSTNTVNPNSFNGPGLPVVTGPSPIQGQGGTSGIDFRHLNLFGLGDNSSGN